ncbi:MAG: hypothetical protein LBL90_04760 [Prevotellaceae bacterium]|nr:hypothetical protein [Prevotellaceae bacterium]
MRLAYGEIGIIHAFSFTPANVCGVNYLKNVKYALSNCGLLGDKGYISANYKLDLFNQLNIKLTVPMRRNQQNQVQFLSSKCRKRIEILIPQLDGQFSMNINFAKTFEGLSNRILSKITALTMIKYLNIFVFNRKLNSIKFNLS